jgi:hypothetical protein
MLEVFVFSMCLKGNPPACESAGSAYYKQSGIEQVVSKREKEYILKYPVMASLLAYTAAAAQGVAIINLGHGNSFTVNGRKSVLGFKSEF